MKNSGSAKKLKLRTKPSERAHVLEKYPNGTEVEVLGLTQSWCHVRVDEKVGFMLSKFLYPQIPFDYSKEK